MSSATHLPISRINRLLRPLRTKCASLASYRASAPSNGSCNVTYANPSSSSSSSSALTSTSSATSLSIIPHPAILTSRFSTDVDLELSKRIYGVNESFKNIIDVALKDTNKTGMLPSAPSPLVPSLASMCANVIGGHIQPDMDESDLDDENDHEIFRHHLEEEINRAIEEVYEAVPPDHRKWTLISHALTLVLTMCPTHHTLISVLLETCLAKGLLIESTILLERLLKNAMRPPKPYQSPPLLHPAHSDWLFYLYISWLGDNSDVFTGRAFVRVLVSTMPSLDSSVWTCKAVSKLATGLQQRDFMAFIQLVSALMDTIRSTRDMSNPKYPELEDLNALCGRLSKWMRRLLEYIYQEPEDITVIGTRVAIVSNLLVHDKVVEMLSRSDVSSGLIGLLVSLSTSFLLSNPSSGNQPFIEALRHVSVDPATFDSLVPIIFSHISFPTSAWTSLLMGRIQRHSRILRKLKLFRLNASFTARCQHYFESSAFHPPVYEGEGTEATLAKMQKLRKWLIELVDDAERKCFGSNPDLGHDPFAVTKVHSSRDDDRKTGQWIYHDMIDAWVKASPAHRPMKRRKVSAESSASTSTNSRVRKPTIRPPKSHGAHTGRSRAVSFSRSITSDTDSMFRTGSTASTVSRSRSPSLSPTTNSDSDEDDANITRLTREFDAMATPRGKENASATAKKDTRRQVQKPQILPDRRRSFATVLTDSLANHTVLHPNKSSGVGNLLTSIFAPIPSKKLAEDYDMPRTTIRSILSNADDIDDDTEDAPIEMGDISFASSDDGLDMFGVLSSSPLRSRGQRI